MRVTSLTFFFVLLFGFPQAQIITSKIQVDGAKRLQQIDGIGVNVNTRSWNGKELEPALDLLLDSLHATIWRVIVESVEKWEEVNDNNDPFVFNWDYYNKLYETPKFQKAWELILYLNNHGVNDNLMINFMGFAPPWMGVKVIRPDKEDEFVEMLVSFFYYGIKTRHIKFGLIAPTNESDHHQFSEGPHLDPKQHARIIRKLIERMLALGIMGKIQIVAPDAADMNKGVNEFIPAMMEDSVVMSKLGHFGLHSYGSQYNYAEMNNSIKKRYPGSSFWFTEWNEWCKGCDDGILGEYDYKFATASVFNLLRHLKNGAGGAIVWEGYDSYYEHHAPSPFSYWGVLAYNATTKKYSPRKHFYAIRQVSEFIAPGSWQVSVSNTSDSLTVLSFYDITSQKMSLVGINMAHNGVRLDAELSNLPAYNKFELVYTNRETDLRKAEDIPMTGKSFSAVIPAQSIFALSSSERHEKPEPANWFAGDIHVHRNCGEGTTISSEEKLGALMDANDLAVISVLADMGNGEVKYSKEDLLKVNGMDAVQSKPGRILHWDAEWHWDATYGQFEHQALGGHLVLLGLKGAQQIWSESPYTILAWAAGQHAVRGFAHFQYLNNKVQSDLDCCIPIDYPVEAALKNIEFISEDVNGADAAMEAYYRLLNCGFRLGLAAGTDFPCNGYEPLGALLTYVNLPDKDLTYQKWIDGIAKGRTVVSRKAHKEFLDMKINSSGPGDEIRFESKGEVITRVTWTSVEAAAGAIELVINGKVIVRQEGSAGPGKPLVLNSTLPFSKSSWICARVVDSLGHRVHTGAVYVIVNNKPIRTRGDDAKFFIDWIDNSLKKIEPGGVWNKYFSKGLEKVKQRYRAARVVYEKILSESSTHQE